MQQRLEGHSTTKEYGCLGQFALTHPANTLQRVKNSLTSTIFVVKCRFIYDTEFAKIVVFQSQMDFDGRVAELADAQDLKSCARLGRTGSSPVSATSDLNPEIPAANRTPSRNQRQSHEKGVPIKVRLFLIVSFEPELNRV
jgi:hypothetical protein